MTGLNHAATGIVLALTIKRPEIAIPLAFLSHFVLDTTPHSFVPMNKKKVFYPYLIAEASAMTLITIICMLAFPSQWLLIGVCAVAAFAPDALWPFYFNGSLRNAPLLKYFYRFHVWIQWSETYRGWLTEILYFTVIIIFLTNYK